MDTKKLRQKILDLAIRGKLVPQDPNDEPASVLLERIRAEKENLVKEGKYKKKDLEVKPVSEDEIPFEIPKSWEWVRINAYTNKVTDFVASGSFASLRENVKYYNSKEYAILVRTKDFQTDFASDLVYTDKHGYDFLENSNLFGGELILPNIGASIGKVFLVPKLDYRMTLAPNTIMIRFVEDSQKDWVYILFLSKFGKNLLYDISGSTAQGKFNKTDFKELVIPIPPLREQQRIVNEIERWFAVIDALESNEGDLLKAIDLTKSKILDLAIHGKLVPQDPNDEPAIELLKRINPKFEPCENEDDNNLLPDSWCWAKGIDIFEPMKSTQPCGETFKYIDIDTIDNKRNIVTSVKVLESRNAPSRASRYTEKGNVLFSMVRPYLRNIAMIPEDNCIASTGFYVCRAKECLNSHYCLYMMLSKYVVNGLNEFMKGDNSPSINKSNIDSFVFPLPPYNEQLRIVAKIEELFAVLDNIKESLE